jgi:hypothetical protein
MAEQATVPVDPRPEPAHDGCGCKSQSGKANAAREILDRRYANGEVTREQYEQIKLDLGASEPKGAKKVCC